ncbi:MAG: hypothetical protein ACLRSW_11560 [Christensenellaceae bacterium]
MGIWLLTAIGCGIAVPVSGDAGAEGLWNRRRYGAINSIRAVLFLSFSPYTGRIRPPVCKGQPRFDGRFWARLQSHLHGRSDVAFLLGGTIVDVLFKASHSSIIRQ